MDSELFTTDIPPGVNADNTPLPAAPIRKVTNELPRIDRHSRFLQSQYRGVQLGSFGFVLEPTALYEILESAKISPLPGVTSICKGLVNHRSKVAPVYDLTELTTVKSGVWERKRLLILNSGESAVAIVLYDLPIQIGISNHVKLEEIIDVPDIFYRHASGAYWNNDIYWLILNRESFFTELNELCVQFK